LLDYKSEKPDKITLPKMIGEKKSREKAEEFIQLAVKCAEGVPRGEFLMDLAESLIDRRT
jgi:hypothetical protein